MNLEIAYLRWEELRQTSGGRARGLILDEIHHPIEPFWLDDLKVWRPLISDVELAEFDVVFLEGLTSQMRTSNGSSVFTTDGRKIQSRIQRAMYAVGKAVRTSKLILVTTPNVFRDLNVFNQANNELSRIDVPILVSGDELVYLLQCYCELIDASTGSDESTQFLTTIERTLADHLTNGGIPFEVQCSIGEYVVSFLIDDHLVVECDGMSTHDAERDAIRDTYFTLHGYLIVRLTGLQIRTDSKQCLDLIQEKRLQLRQRDQPSNFYQNSTEYLSLSEDQKLAAGHVFGPARVIAPAGSGKTTVVAERVVNLVSAGAVAKRIQCVSYTNVAVEEMKRKFTKKSNELSLPSLLEVRTSTLNRIGSLICHESGKFPKRKVINVSMKPGQVTRKQILRTALTKLSTTSTERKKLLTQDHEIFDAISRYRQTLVPPVLDKDELDLGVESALDREFKFMDIHRAYVSEMRRQNVTDFDGQILDAITILSSDRTLRINQAKQIDYWIVDEYQDLASPKLMLLRLLVAPSRNIMVVGDDDQTIFGFAGARAELFDSLLNEWGDLHTYLLNINYRSEPEIVTRSRWLISRNNLRIKKMIIPSPDKRPDGTARVELSDNNSYWDRALLVINEEIANGAPLNQIGLLFRSSYTAAPVEKILSEAGIPHNKIVKRSFFRNLTIRRLRSWMRVVNHIGTESDWSNVFEWPDRIISMDLLKLLHDAATTGESIEKYIEDMILQQSAKESIRDHLKEILDRIRLSRSAGIDPARQFKALGLWPDIVKVDEEANLGESAKILPSDLQGARTKFAFDDSAVTHRIAYEAFEDLLRTSSNFTKVEKWMHRAETDSDIRWDEEFEQDSLESKVRLSTIHGFKGKQCEVICVLGRPESMPHHRAITIEELEEERRVAYVAATRAQRRLIFASSSTYEKELSISLDGETWEVS